MVVLLAQQSPTLLAASAPALLQALSGAVKDPALAVRRLMSTAIAQVAKLCPPATVEKLVVHLRAVYLETAPDGTEKDIPPGGKPTLTKKMLRALPKKTTLTLDNGPCGARFNDTDLGHRTLRRSF